MKHNQIQWFVTTYSTLHAEDNHSSSFGVASTVFDPRASQSIETPWTYPTDPGKMSGFWPMLINQTQRECKNAMLVWQHTATTGMFWWCTKNIFSRYLWWQDVSGAIPRNCSWKASAASLKMVVLCPWKNIDFANLFLSVKCFKIRWQPPPPLFFLPLILCWSSHITLSSSDLVEITEGCALCTLEDDLCVQVWVNAFLVKLPTELPITLLNP